MIIPPTELEAYEVMHAAPETIKNVIGKRKKPKDLSKFTKVVSLEDLNEEERDSLLPLFFEFSFQFRLPGDKLGATNVAKHKIKTNNDEPVHTKQYRYPHIHKSFIRYFSNRNVLHQCYIQAGAGVIFFLWNQVGLVLPSGPLPTW